MGGRFWVAAEDRSSANAESTTTVTSQRLIITAATNRIIRDFERFDRKAFVLMSKGIELRLNARVRAKCLGGISASLQIGNVDGSEIGAGST